MERPEVGAFGDRSDELHEQLHCVVLQAMKEPFTKQDMLNWICYRYPQ